MVLEGSKISNEKIKKAGFKFRYDKVDDALKAIYQNN
jgi:NAD dependent epimerase/dehydratase family enzyme